MAYRIAPLTALLLSSTLLLADTQPFAVEWLKDPRSPADVSFLLDAPAGKDGFVSISAGHLVTGPGKRLRIWGMNVSGKGCLPPKEDAPIIAANLARLGVNCIRFHFMDRPAPGGIMDASRKDTRALDPAQLDKLDTFVAELKKRGIYSDLNLNVARPFKYGDGVKDIELIGYAKSLTYFDPPIIELEKEYAQQLLTHKNPYTGNEYRNEPAVAIVELLNENSLVEAWFGGRLIGKNTRKNPGTWSDIPESFGQQLTALYNQWLEKNLPKDQLAKIRAEAKVADGQPLSRLAPSEFGKAPADRFNAEARFYMSVEETFIKDMQKFLKQDLKVHAPLVANSDHGHSKTGYPQVAAESLLDIVDGHVYWQHPSYIEDPKTGKHTGFWIKNTPMVNDPLYSTIVQLSRSAVAGKPYTVSEFNHPFPNSYACEGLPILAAYAAFQDWDGIFCYTLNHDDLLAMKQVIKGHFDYCRDPVKMAQIPAGALMFLRGDVQPAKQTIERSYTRQQVIDSIRLPRSESPYYTPGFDLSTPLRHAVRIKSLDAPAPQPIERAATVSKDVDSDTGELKWQAACEFPVVTVNTPRTQAIIGNQGPRDVQLKHLNWPDLKPPFCAITLGSLDDKPIAQSARLLLTAGAAVENTDMKWNDKRTSLESWGKEPTRIENVTGSIQLKAIDGAKQITLTPMDGAGKPIGQPIPGKKETDAWKLPLGTVPTTWYLVTIER